MRLWAAAEEVFQGHQVDLFSKLGVFDGIECILLNVLNNLLLASLLFGLLSFG